MSAASTMTGVEAVYQLRGPSWTTTCSAAAAARIRATAMAGEASERDAEPAAHSAVAPAATQR